MLNQYAFLLFSLLMFYGSCVDAQIPAIQQLQEENKVSLNLHFYPSTLRMINMQNDTSFNRLIKDIEKLSFYQVDTDAFGIDELSTLSNRLVEEETYEEYMTMDGKELLMQVMGKESGDEWVAMGSMEEQIYLIAVQGKVNWLQLPKVIETISSQDSTAAPTGFSILGNYLKEQQAYKERRRERQQQREAETAEEEATKEKNIKPKEHQH